MPSKLRTIFAYLRKENRLLLFTLAFFLFFSVASYAFASFFPGQTNDPSCGPTDPTCIVDIFPTQAGHAGEVLSTDGTTASWSSAGAGSVTSVATDSTLTGGTITTTGTLGLNLANPNTWTAQQTFSSAAPIFGTLTTNGGIFYGDGTGTLHQTGAGGAHTLLHGGATPSYGAVDLASADVTGVVPVANGGTNLNSLGAGDTILGVNTGGTALEYKALTGDVTLSGSTLTIGNNKITSAKINAGAVTYGKIQNVAAVSLLGNPTGSSANASEITLGSGLAFSGTTLTATGAGSIGTIDGTSKSANGLVISGGVLFAQTADTTNPGMVSTGTQTFAGNKTFNGSLTASGGFNAGGNVVASVASPVAGTDAANKNYVDNLASGVKWKTLVAAATSSALPANTYATGASGVGATLTANANGTLTIDGTYTPVLNDRLLIKDEATQSHNGIYTLTTVGNGSTPWVLTRATDADQAAELVDAAVGVDGGGATNTNKAFIQTTPATITVGTDPIVWVNFISTAYNAGTGISLSGGNTFNVDFSTVTGTLGIAHGGTGLTTHGAANTLLGVDPTNSFLEYKTVGGDLTLSGSTFTIANNAVTNAKINNGEITTSKLHTLTATSSLIGSNSTSTAATEITLGTGLSMSGNVLSASGTGSVTSITAGSGLSGGTITTSGTITLNLANANTWTGQQTFNSAAPIFGTMTTNGGILYTNGSGLLQQTGAGTSTQVLHGGTSPSYSAVSLTADVTGALPIANGGTGQTTKAAAFNALSPITTTGDLIYGNAASSAARLAIGSSGQCLVVSSGVPAWGACTTGGGVTTLGAIGSTPNANGGTITGTSLTLQPASSSFGGVVTTGAQTFAGTKTFSSDINIIHGSDTIDAGIGAGGVSTNTVFGVLAGAAQTGSSNFNVLLGYQGGRNVTSGANNVLMGENAGLSVTSGNYNVGIGDKALGGNTAGGSTETENTAIGASAGLVLTSGHYNTLIGTEAGLGLNTGSSNIIINTNTGAGLGGYGATALTSGSQNVFIGTWNGMASNATGTIGISDGAGNLRLYVNGSGLTNIGGNTSPTNLFSVGSSSQFQVTSGGAIAAATGITSSGTITFSGLSTANGSAAVCISGGVLSIASSSCTVPSALRFKTDVTTLTGNLDKVMELRPVSYTMIADGSHSIGFIAEEVATVENRLVDYDQNGQIMGLNYAQFAPILAGAIQELNVKIAPLQSIDPNQTGSLASLILSFLQNATVTIKDATLGTLHINDNVCVDDVCVTKDQFKSLLLQARSSSTASSAGEAGSGPAETGTAPTGGSADTTTTTDTTSTSDSSTTDSTPSASDTTTTSTPPTDTTTTEAAPAPTDTSTSPATDSATTGQ